MPLLSVQDPDARIVVQGGALAVERGGHTVRVAATREVDELHLHGRATLTASARDLCLRLGIPVVYLTMDGRIKGRLIGPIDRHAARRRAQMLALDDPARKLALAQAIIAGKIHNQRQVLRERNRRHRDESVAGVLAALRALIPRVATTESVDVLRGVEGLVARHYFAGFAASLRNENFVFDGRNRHPPRDPPNACLSFGYAIVQARVEQAAHAAGLDPYFGALHEPGRGAPCLALDLLEEWRPLVDGAVLTLLNRRQLGPEDFRVPTDEELGARAELVDGDAAVYLGSVARTAVLHAIESALNQTATHPVRGDQWTRRALIREQAYQIVRLVEGQAETYRPVQL